MLDLVTLGLRRGVRSIPTAFSLQFAKQGCWKRVENPLTVDHNPVALPFEDISPMVLRFWP